MNGLGNDLLSYPRFTADQYASRGVGRQTGLSERGRHRRTLPNNIVEGEACFSTNDPTYQLVDALHGAEGDQGAEVAPTAIPDWAYGTDDTDGALPPLPDQLLLSEFLTLRKDLTNEWRWIECSQGMPSNAPRTYPEEDGSPAVDPAHLVAGSNKDQSVTHGFERCVELRQLVVRLS